MGYEDVMNTSKALDTAEASHFQPIIGVMRCMVKIGRIDIATEVSLLLPRLAYPGEGYL